MSESMSIFTCHVWGQLPEEHIVKKMLLYHVYTENIYTYE